MSHQIIFDTLKEILRSKKIRYRELGENIGLSESGIKKLLTSSDISLSRLAQISEVIGISLAEILRVAEEKEIKSVHLSARQEEALFQDHGLFRVFWFLTVVEKSIAEVAKIEKVRIEKIEKYLRELENLDLLRIGKNGKISSFHRGLYKWTDDGKFLRRLNQDWSESTLKKVLADMKNKKNYHRLSYLKLKVETIQEFYIELNHLIDNYARRSIREQLESPKSNLLPVCSLIAVLQDEFI